MAGTFDLKTGAFDSSEAALLLEAYEIAVQGLKSTHKLDGPLGQRLARSIIKVARSEPDCLRNDGSIDPVKLAQRAILRMLQKSPADAEPEAKVRKPTLRERLMRKPLPPVAPPKAELPPPESPAKIMLKIFDRTPFAKL